MAALNVSNELLQNKNKQTDAQAKVAARVQKLSDQVADAISANKQMQI